MDISTIVNQNIYKSWVKFVIPTMIGILLSTIYSAVDAIFVGQGVGEVGLASINIVWPSVAVVIGIGMMIGVGSSNIISICLGNNEIEDAEKCLGTALKFILLIGLVLMILGLSFREPILKILGANDETIGYARDYYTIIYIIIIPYILSIALSTIVRTEGRPDLSMFMIGIGAVINIILDYILVIKYNFGTKGAAIATSGSIFISMIISIYYFTKGNSKIKFRKEYFKIDLEILSKILRIGFVSFAIQFSYAVIIWVQNNVIYNYGTTKDIAIFTVAAYINCFIVNLFMGIGQGVQPLIGYYLGASKEQKIKEIMKFSIIIGIVFGILCLGMLFIFGEKIVYVFGIDSKDLKFASDMMIVYCFGTPIIGILFTSSSFYQIREKTLYSNVISISRGFVFQFIFTIIMPVYFGVIGVFLSLPLAELVSLLILIIIILFDKKIVNKYTKK